MVIARASRLWNPAPIAIKTAALAISAMILIGVGSCAELDAQDASHARKPATAESAAPNPAEPADQNAIAGSTDATSATEPTLDLIAGEAPHADRHPKPVETNQAAPADTTAPFEQAIPSIPEVAPVAPALKSLLSLESSPLESFFEPSPLDLREWSVTGNLPIQQHPVSENTIPMQLVQVASVVAATDASTFPVFPLLPANHSIEANTAGSKNVSAQHDAPSPFDNDAVRSFIATATQSATFAHSPSHPATHESSAAQQISTDAFAESVIIAPKPLSSEPPARPFKPMVVDVAASLVLPSCITQQPIPATAQRPPSPTHPAPPTASVMLTSSVATAAAPVSPAIPYFLLAAMAIAFITTCGIAFLTSSTTDSTGTSRRALTIPCRITLAIGTLAVVLIGSCRFGAAISTSIGGQITCAVFAAIGATLCVGAGLWLCRAISGPVAASLFNIRALDSGNLLVAPINSTSRDELGELARATDKLAASMKDIISEVAISSSEVAAAASELAIGAKGMSAAAGQVSSQCAVAAGDASTAGRLATSGGRSLQQAAAEITRIDEFVHTSTDSVRTLANRGRQIARVVELIDDIADRTHLVALNASIEASKAGPNGRAFAVLADEVRRLAERAQNATEEVTSTIRGVQDDCTAAADRMSFGAAQIKQSADLTGRAGHDLAEIIRTAGGVSSMIQTISTAAEEAGAGAAQSAGAAAQLSNRAGDLKAMVDRFRIDTTSFMRHAPT